MKINFDLKAEIKTVDEICWIVIEKTIIITIGTNCLSIPIIPKISKNGLLATNKITAELNSEKINDDVVTCLNRDHLFSAAALLIILFIPCAISILENETRIRENDAIAETVPMDSGPVKFDAKIQNTNVSPDPITLEKNTQNILLLIFSDNLFLDYSQ